MVDRSSGSRPGSTSSSARALLREAGLDCEVVVPVVEQGWASWTYFVDDALIARFPRNDEIADASRRELRMLPALAAHVSFRVPEPVVWGDDWFAYELIPGRGLRRDDDVDAALAMIAELHSFPVASAEQLLGRPPWEDRLAAEWRAIAEVVFPLLDEELVDRVQAVAAPAWSGPRTFVHADLGPEHVIVDDASGRPVGIIDFEEADVGDPAMDLLPTVRLAGRPLTDTMWAYGVRGTLHALQYYVTEDLPDEIPGVVDELRRRLDAQPRR